MRTLIDFDDAPVFAVPTASGVREGVLLDGPQGWGEFSPPADADDALAARWLTAAMEPSTVG
ncbi:O-succinylbenzoate-CoA synthase, partial [Mycobacterium sp. ITM-2017-0098]